MSQLKPKALEDALSFFSKIQSLLPEYKKVKDAIILAEKLDPQREVFVAPLNELRSAFDHVMIGAYKPDCIEEQFDEAKTHIRRAGYDTYEQLTVNISKSIYSIVNKYSTQVITNVFPEYFQEIAPAIELIYR